jgi:hypothetical protein
MYVSVYLDGTTRRKARRSEPWQGFSCCRVSVLMQGRSALGVMIALCGRKAICGALDQYRPMPLSATACTSLSTDEKRLR